MYRRSLRRCFFPSMPGGGSSGGSCGPGNGSNQMNQLAQMMQQRQQQQQGGGAGGLPFDLQQMREQMRSQMPAGMVEQMQNALKEKMQNGGIEFGMMGTTVNEKGKRVAVAGKARIDIDPVTGKPRIDPASMEMHKQQLDPDDPMLPKETVENYDTENCIEVTLEEDADKLAEGKQKGSAASEDIKGEEIVIEQETK